MVKLTTKSFEVLNYVREHGGRASTDDIAEALDRTKRSVNANVTDLCSEKKGLAMRDAVVDDEGNKTTFVVLTDDGMAYQPATEDAE